jgi:hypothetical protein
VGNNIIDLNIVRRANLDRGNITTCAPVNLLHYGDKEVEVEGLCSCPTLETYKALKVFIRWHKY